MNKAGPLIAFERITKVYGEGSAMVRALAGVDLAIAPGEFLAIMGPSGSGKSTAMNILGCLDTPSAGRYLFGGVDVARLDRTQRALLRRNYLGFVFQGYKNVELPLVYRGTNRHERRQKALEALRLVGLAGREHHTPAELSGGQQQRVAIARAIVADPYVLLADEPTGNLDSARSREIMELLLTLNAERGLTIIMVTHEPDMAEFAHRTLRFADGRIESQLMAEVE